MGAKGIVIDRLRPGVVDEAGEAMGDLLLQRGLERVVYRVAAGIGGGNLVGVVLYGVG